MYVVERWLARLSRSPYADQFVLKGGMLLAAFDARRATADADTLARDLSNDETAVLARVVEIAGQPVADDGVVFRAETATARANPHPRLPHRDSAGREHRHSHRTRRGEHPCPYYADVYTLTGRHDITYTSMREALLATVAFRGMTLHPLSEIIDGLVGLRAATYTAYRTSLGPDGAHLPVQFAHLVNAVTTFADPLAESAQPQMI